MAITTINLSSLDGSNGFLLDGEALFAHFSGASVSSAGDINGDGFDDVMIGAYYEYRHYTLEGFSYVVFGKASGFDAHFNLDNLDGSHGSRLDVGESNGVSVSGAGDVNGDGFDDVIVGANNAGYVVFGQAAGFDAVRDLSSLDGSNGFRLKGVSTRDESVSSAGDINGDGFDDLIVSAGDSGVYVVFGKSSNFEATLDLSSLDGSNGFHLIDLENSPFISVSNAGDINGDGFDDVIIGDGFAGLNGENSGSSCVVFGKASGFTVTFDLSHIFH